MRPRFLPTHCLLAHLLACVCAFCWKIYDTRSRAAVVTGATDQSPLHNTANDDNGVFYVAAVPAITDRQQRHWSSFFCDDPSNRGNELRTRLMTLVSSSLRARSFLGFD